MIGQAIEYLGTVHLWRCALVMIGVWIILHSFNRFVDGVSRL